MDGSGGLGPGGAAAIDTLWFVTGSACNLACRGCHAGSSPEDDRLDWLTATEVGACLDEAAALGWPVRRAAFTGGEPFAGPDFPALLAAALDRGMTALALTNAMRPMQRPCVAAPLAALIRRGGDRLEIRVSLDHWDSARHDAGRAAGAFAKALKGLRWLAGEGASLSVAARDDGDEPALRAGFARLFAAEALPVDAFDPEGLVIQPDLGAPVPGGPPCATSRAVLRRRGAARPAVVACAWRSFDAAAEAGPTLAAAARRAWGEGALCRACRGEA